MVEALTSKQFHESPGVGDWEVAENVASASFATGSFARGVELVDVIGALADAANHHPDVDLRYSVVVIRLSTHEIHGLSDLDVALARQISVAARELQIAPDSTTARTRPTDPTQ
jgi:4a-hydroxytetrahydrobiopterin dehydratase